MIIKKIFKHSRDKRATDIHIIVGSPVLVRLEGELYPISSEVLDSTSAKKLSYSLLNQNQIKEFEENLDLDFMYVDEEHNRYRVNLSYNDGNVGAVIRLLAGAPIPLAKIKLPPIVNNLTEERKGLILITGSTSQGKTTTLASLIDAVNEKFRKNIVTIEDPIEYVHTNKNSIVRQREVGKDTKSFANGLRAAMRQDPDVIAIGEMRDYETIKIALTAAETGILVLSTLHIISIDKLIERLLSYAPDGSDGHMRALISEGLLAVIHQELLPIVDGGKRVASEILIASHGVRNIIRKESTFRLSNFIATGQKHGMQTMKKSLDMLLEEEAITQSIYEEILKNYTL